MVVVLTALVTTYGYELLWEELQFSALHDNKKWKKVPACPLLDVVGFDGVRKATRDSAGLAVEMNERLVFFCVAQVHIIDWSKEQLRLTRSLVQLLQTRKQDWCFWQMAIFRCALHRSAALLWCTGAAFVSKFRRRFIGKEIEQRHIRCIILSLGRSYS